MSKNIPLQNEGGYLRFMKFYALLAFTFLITRREITIIAKDRGKQINQLRMNPVKM